MRPFFLLLMAAAQLLPGQPPPSFDQYAIPAAPFKGKPASPIFKTKSERMFRTAIRDAAARGPNFAGHFTIAEWGCGAGCVSMVVVDAATGAIYPAPFRVLSPSNGDNAEPLSYNLNSRLLIARGCPEETNCASYFYEWSGRQFKLLRQIPSAPH